MIFKIPSQSVIRCNILLVRLIYLFALSALSLTKSLSSLSIRLLTVGCRIRFLHILIHHNLCPYFTLSSSALILYLPCCYYMCFLLIHFLNLLFYILLSLHHLWCIELFVLIIYSVVFLLSFFISVVAIALFFFFLRPIMFNMYILLYSWCFILLLSCLVRFFLKLSLLIFLSFVLHWHSYFWYIIFFIFIILVFCFNLSFLGNVFFYSLLSHDYIHRPSSAAVVIVLFHFFFCCCYFLIYYKVHILPFFKLSIFTTHCVVSKHRCDQSHTAVKKINKKTARLKKFFKNTIKIKILINHFY